MRIILCGGQIPFVHGGAEILVQALKQELVTRGHQVDVVQLPLRWDVKVGVVQGYLAWRLLDLVMVEGQKTDLLIATKFPSFAVRHPNKVTWLIQQFRQLYELYASEYSPYGHLPEDRAFQQVIHQADTRTLGESKRIFTISQNVANRLVHYNGLPADVLYPPPKNDGRFRHEAYGDYILTVNRLNVMKRVDLLIEAMAHVRSGARCLIVGTGTEEAALKKLARHSRVGDRIEFLGYVDDEELLSLYANALAVYYAPYDEDYGYATVEGFKAQKPVLTATDSGGVLEFVEDGITGYAFDPAQPAQLAEQIDRLYNDRAACRRLGQAGFERVRAITWQATIPRLLGE
jgi:glycosyltransferase involved in cell wall biosynthesis